MSKKTRLMSILVSLALLVGILPTAAFAADEQAVSENAAAPVELEAATISAHLTDGSLQADEADVMKINDDMETLYTYGVVTDEAQVQEIEISENGEITYLVEFGDIENLLTVRNVEGGVQMRSQQGDITSVVTIYDDGRAFLNENQLTVAQPVVTERVAASGVMPRSMKYWQENVPFYGTEESYSNPHSEGESIADIDFMTAVANITVSAFVTIFVGAMTFGTTSIIASLGVSVLSGIGTSFYQYLSNNDPYSRAASYIATSYTVRKGTGYIDANYGYQYKYDFSFYTRENFGGTKYEETWYMMILPNA